MTPERLLLFRAYRTLLWCSRNFWRHTYEGSPSTLFQSRLDALLEDIRIHLKTTSLPEDPPLDDT